MSTQSSPGSRKCMRCLGDLPEGVNFCVACGFNNDMAVYGKMAGSVASAQNRQDKLRARAQMPRGLGLLGWLMFWR